MSFCASSKILFIDFSPLITFYTVNYFFDIRAALLASIVYSILLLLVLKIKNIKVGYIVMLSATLSIVFGIIDLSTGSITLSKFDSVFINLILAFMFGMKVPVN